MVQAGSAPDLPGADSPNLAVESLSCRPSAQPGSWVCGWRVTNLGETGAEIRAVWLPHDQFLSENREYQPPLLVESQGSVDLEIPVDCREPAGSTIDNAFVILRLEYYQRDWRIFARQEVKLDEKGVPQAMCRSVTWQPAGG